jgi:hypothetical protein
MANAEVAAAGTQRSASPAPLTTRATVLKVKPRMRYSPLSPPVLSA